MKDTRIFRPLPWLVAAVGIASGFMLLSVVVVQWWNWLVPHLHHGLWALK